MPRRNALSHLAPHSENANEHRSGVPCLWFARRPVAHPALPLLLLVLAATLLFSNVVAAGFAKLGLPRPITMLILLGSVVGSLVNIPLRRREHVTESAQLLPAGPWLYYRPPQIEARIVAVNLGGALVPLALSIFLLWHAPLLKIAVATLAMAAITFKLARPQPGVGITLPVLLPPVLAGGIAWLLSGGGGPQTAAIAYVGGSIGSLLGADLLHLPDLEELGPGVLSIGGAGVFDGVFLVGLVAALLT